MLPVAEHLPSCRAKLLGCVDVARDVRRNLARPVVHVVAEGFAPMLRASMPKASIDKHRDVSASEDDVGTTIQTVERGEVNAVSQSDRV